MVRGKSTTSVKLNRFRNLFLSPFVCVGRKGQLSNPLWQETVVFNAYISGLILLFHNSVGCD